MIKIKPIQINKKSIAQCSYAQCGVLPKHPFRSYLIGASGSGKTNMLLNLLTREGFYKNYFDKIFVISPTACKLDESYQSLERDTKYQEGKDLLYFPCKKEVLQQILDIQEDTKKKDKVLVILDDIVSYGKFCRSNQLLQFAVMSRHFNVSMFILSQAFYLIPKPVRLNMSWIIYFKGSNKELTTIVEEYCPGGMDDKEFRRRVSKATEEPYSFLFIDLNTKLHGRIPRYRKCLTGNLMELNIDE